MSELQAAIRSRGGPVTESSERKPHQNVRRVHSGVSQQPTAGTEKGDYRSVLSPRSPGPRRPVIPIKPGVGGDFTSALCKEITKGHELRSTGERRMKEIRRVDVACSPPPTPSRSILRQSSAGGLRLDEAG